MVSEQTHNPSAAVSATQIRALQTVTADYGDVLCFYLNGSKVNLDSTCIEPEVTLLEYLRGLGLTGTKLGCAEGGCGACTVVVSQINPTTKRLYHASVNACIAPLVSVDGKHVITVEAIGTARKPHPVQERIASGNGSQCGFCTPGIVMSLYALLKNTTEPSTIDVEEAFDGNLCRCTGYRPILDAAHTFSLKEDHPNGAQLSCLEDCVADNASSNGPCIKNLQVNGDLPKKRASSMAPTDGHLAAELNFPSMLRQHEFKPLMFGNKRKKWIRPVNILQLLQLKNAYPSSKIIGGSTETQIEIKFKAMQYNVSIYVGDIAELRQYTFHDEYLEIGANVVLTDLEDICQEALEFYGSAKGQPFEAIRKQIKYFAGRQIRNVGTPAGNLATASPISDLNPVFVASNTTLVAKTLHGDAEIPMSDFFKGYRTTALPPDAIIAYLRIPVSLEKGEYLRAYKQAKRKDDDIAIANAALRVTLNASHRVETVNLIFGGLAPTTKAAIKAAEFLQGKNWTDAEVLEGAMSALSQDFDLRFGVPGGMATYRKSLALGFFYRFYHETLTLINIDESQIDHDVWPEIVREISTGQKDEQASQAYKQRVLGKAEPHVAALKQCTGEAQYTDDIPVHKNELYGALVLSTKAHAKIVGIDTEAALNLPGVFIPSHSAFVPRSISCHTMRVKSVMHSSQRQDIRCSIVNKLQMQFSYSMKYLCIVHRIKVHQGWTGRMYTLNQRLRRKPSIPVSSIQYYVTSAAQAYLFSNISFTNMSHCGRRPRLGRPSRLTKCRCELVGCTHL